MTLLLLFLDSGGGPPPPNVVPQSFFMASYSLTDDLDFLNSPDLLLDVLGRYGYGGD